MDMKKIIMTGTNGFIGGQLKKRMSQMGYQILSIEKDNWKSDLCGMWMDPLIRPGDIMGIFHIGANTSVQYKDSDLWEDNYYLSKQIMKFAYEYRVPHFIFSSTSALYGNDGIPCNHYGWSKLVTEDYGLSYFQNSDTNFISLRYFNVFGPGEKHKGKLSSVILQSYTNNLFSLFKGLSRDYVHIEDVVNANLYALRHLTSSGCFDVGTGISTDTVELVSYANPDWKNIPIIESPYENIQTYTCANPNNFMYGWQPLMSTKDGSISYGEYIRNGGWEYEL